MRENVLDVTVTLRNTVLGSGPGAAGAAK